MQHVMEYYCRYAQHCIRIFQPAANGERSVLLADQLLALQWNITRYALLLNGHTMVRLKCDKT